MPREAPEARPSSASADTDRPEAHASTAISSDVADVPADRYGASPEQVELAWTPAGSPVVLAIPGTSSAAHVEDNIAAADLHLHRKTWPHWTPPGEAVRRPFSPAVHRSYRHGVARAGPWSRALCPAMSRSGCPG
ncbi:aldo/keto reductase [Streptomyces sp. NPDC056194]|uniref:aldo/keto reductase n=1 Tax=unclassified Streptomyces TaxID=2593676 RepID=UPI0035D69734